MSYKRWTGEKLYSADLNQYLVDQSVPRFASGAARDAATTWTDGQLAYVTGVGLQIRESGAWNTIYPRNTYDYLPRVTQGANTPAATRTFGATHTTHPDLAVTFIKNHASSYLNIYVRGGAYINTVPGSGYISAKTTPPGGSATFTLAGQKRFATANAHDDMHGWVSVTGAAGTWNIGIGMATPTAGATLSSDGYDWLEIIVMETRSGNLA